jgi:hypothetical protein
MTEPRPSYEERRLAQFAAGAQPIPPKKRVSPIRIAWTPCLPQDLNLKTSRKPTPFKTESLANEANELMFEIKRYRERVTYCSTCKAFHLAHIFSSEVPKSQMPTQAESTAPPDAPQAPIPAPCCESSPVEVPVEPCQPEQPTQASVAPTSFEEWLANARKLANTGKCLSWDIGDHINFGKRMYGAKALTAVKTATGWTDNYITRVASVCERFPIENRHPEVSFFVHRSLVPFDDTVALPLLARAAKEKIGARRLYVMACEMAGADPKAKCPRRDVSIPTALYEKLRERANGVVVSKLVREILEGWMAS